MDIAVSVRTLDATHNKLGWFPFSTLDCFRRIVEGRKHVVVTIPYPIENEEWEVVIIGHTVTLLIGCWRYALALRKQYWLKAHIRRPSKYLKTRSEYFNVFMIKEEWHFIIFSQKHLRACNLKMHHVDKRGSYKLDSLYRYRWRHPSKPQEQAERKKDSFIENQ